MPNNDNWREKMEKLLEEHSKRLEEIEKKQIKDKFELSNLITEAVQKGITPLIDKIDKHSDRLTTLEQAEAQKALKNNNELWKTIRTVTITIIATLVVNNALDIITYKKNNNINDSGVIINENNKSNNKIN